jgi:nucleoid DNA-binding protein
MTIQYEVTENPLQEGTYFPRVVPGDTVPMPRTLKAIVRETGVSRTDVKAVLDATAQRVQLALLEGNAIALEGLGIFSLSMSETLDSVEDKISDEMDLRVNVRVDADLINAVKKDADYEKVTLPERAPVLTGFLDVATGQENAYTAGSIAHITGEDLTFDAGAADEGVFFVADDETETRATVYSDVGSTRVAFLVPADLSGEQSVEIRTRYGTQRLRSGGYRPTVTSV